MKVGANGGMDIHPVTLWQQNVLEEGTHPDATDALRDRFVLPNAMLIQPRIDIRRFERAIRRLTDRHDGLRIRFRESGSAWEAVIAKKHKEVLRIIEMGDVADEDFFRTIRAIANESMPLINSPLFECIIIKCGERGDVLILKVHHIVADGHAVMIIIEDLMKLLIGIPLDDDVVSHADYIRKFQSPLPSRAEAVREFWDEQHMDLPAPPKALADRKSVSDALPFDPKILTCVVSEDGFSRLQESMSCLNVSSATALMVGYFEAICDCFDVKKITVTTNLGRSDPLMRNFVGDHTLDPIFIYSFAGKEKLSASAVWLRNSIARIREHLPSDAARRGTPYQKDLYGRLGHAVMFCANQPRPTLLEDRSIFKQGVEADYGEQQPLGPYLVTKLDVSVRRRKSQLLSLELQSGRNECGFKIHYNGNYISNPEVTQIAKTMCSFLGLNATKVELS